MSTTDEPTTEHRRRSTNTTTDEAATETNALTVTPDPPADPAPATTGQESEATPDREAARYRVRLRETEGRLAEVEVERDALAGRLVEHDRREVIALAEQRLADGEDVLAAVELDAMREPDSGRIDPNRVALAVANLIEAKPHYAKALRSPNPGQAAPFTDERPGKTWADLLAGGGR